MEIQNLTGLEKPLTKLVEVVSNGVGNVTRPYLIRKTAEARAYEIEIISKSIKDNQQELEKIGFDSEGLSISSLDWHSIQEEKSIDQRSKDRLDYKEKKRQRNIENITQKAFEDIGKESTVSDEPVDEDWTTRFFDYAEDISNKEMQELWGKILAGEVKKPKTYSLRTLETLRNLSKEEAEVFQKFASLAIHCSGVSFILNFNNEKLLQEKYKLKFNERLLLQELGIIASNDLGFQVYATEDKPQKTVFEIGEMVLIQDKEKNKPQQEFSVLVFTKIGKELLNLISYTPNLDYIQLPASKLKKQNGPIKYAKIKERKENNEIEHEDLIDVPLEESDVENNN
jgi:uncharacterized repeat protein (TIGR03899 family)